MDQAVLANGHLKRVPSSAATFGIIVGTLVLIGWTFDVELLKGMGHRITMKPNAAIGLMACGVSLLGHTIGGPLWRRVALGGALLSGTLGTLTLSEHLIGWDLGIDELLFKEPAGAVATTSPARMGPNASTSLLLASIALVALHRPTTRAATVAQVAASGMAILAMIALVGYLYGTQQLYSVARYTAIAWPTALTLLVLAMGLLAARDESGPVAALVSTGPGGVIARRLLLPVLFGPLAIGAIVHLGLDARFYDAGFATATLVVLVTTVLTIAVWLTAIKLDETSRAREIAQRERDELLVRERAAREEAERSNRLKDEFLATMSHELRTPLNTLLGWIAMLRSDVVGSDRREHAIDVISRNGKLLARLVEDLLDVSRIATGRLRLHEEHVNLAPLVSTVAEAIADEAAARGVRVCTRTDGVSAIVAGDRQRLQQIVGNLLSNALKFTPRGGRIEVEVVTSLSSVMVRVTDTGHGIDPAFLPHVFDRFRQADGTPTREHGGLGIGLSIVRELAELHGGTVEASSAGRERGATFTVTFPLVTDDGGQTID